MGDKKRAALVEFNRDQILKAARNLFESVGVENTTVNAIASQADCSKSTMYVYFKSKEDIVNNIIFEQMQLLKNILEQCIEEVDFFKAYQNICKEMQTYQTSYPVYFQMLQQHIQLTKALEPDNILYKIYQVGESINDILGQYLVRGIDQGKIRKDLQIIPTILYFWSSIGEIIRFSHEKEEYLHTRLAMTRQEYLDFSFELLLKSIRED